MNADRKSPADGLAMILREIGQGRPAPSYLLWGEDFLVREALDKIVAALVPEADRSFNLFFMEPEQTDIDRLCDELTQVPLLPGNKVVAVRQAAFLQADRQAAADYLRKAREYLETDPLRAAREFMIFLEMAGWALDDLRDNGWRRLGDEEWDRTGAGDQDEDREKWLPRLLEFCVAQQILPQRRKTDPARLEELLRSGLPAGNILVLTAAGIDKRKRLVRILTETGKVLQFAAARGESRQQSLLMAKTKEILARSGKSLTPEAWQMLGRKTGFELTAATQAIETLTVYTGDRREIGPEDVAQVIGKTKEDHVFDLTAALGDKAAPEALRVLRELITEQGVQPLVVLAMLVREIRFLLHARIYINSGRIKSWRPGLDYDRFQMKTLPEIRTLTGDREEKGEVGELADEKPYVIYQACRRAHRFADAALIKCLQELARLDVQMKTTGRNPHLMLENFILSFCTS